MEEDFVLPWEAAKKGPRASSSSVTGGGGATGGGGCHKKRRSSILKQKTFGASPSEGGRPRVALQEVNGRALGGGGGQAEAAAAAMAKKRRSMKRVSFSASKTVKEFQTGSETLTVWNNTYEEEQHSSSASAAPAPQPNNADVVQASTSRKRSQADTDNQENVGGLGGSPPKRRTLEPLHVDIPAAGAGGATPHAFLASFEGGPDLMKPVAPQESGRADSNDFLRSLSSRRAEEGEDNFLKELEERTDLQTSLNTSLNRGATSRLQHLFGVAGATRDDLEKSMFPAADDSGSDLSALSMDITRQVESLERTFGGRDRILGKLDKTSRFDKTRLGDDQSFMDITRTLPSALDSQEKASDKTTLPGDQSLMEMTRALPSPATKEDSTIKAHIVHEDENAMEFTSAIPAAAAKESTDRLNCTSNSNPQPLSGTEGGSQSDAHDNSLMEMTKPLSYRSKVSNATNLVSPQSGKCQISEVTRSQSVAFAGDQSLMEITTALPSALKSQDDSTNKTTLTGEACFMEMTGALPSVVTKGNTKGDTAQSHIEQDENAMKFTTAIPQAVARETSEMLHNAPNANHETLPSTESAPTNQNLFSGNNDSLMEMTKPLSHQVGQPNNSNASDSEASPGGAFRTVDVTKSLSAAFKKSFMHKKLIPQEKSTTGQSLLQENSDSHFQDTAISLGQEDGDASSIAEPTTEYSGDLAKETCTIDENMAKVTNSGPLDASKYHLQVEIEGTEENSKANPTEVDHEIKSAENAAPSPMHVKEKQDQAEGQGSTFATSEELSTQVPEKGEETEYSETATSEQKEETLKSGTSKAHDKVKSARSPSSQANSNKNKHVQSPKRGSEMATAHEPTVKVPEILEEAEDGLKDAALEKGAREEDLEIKSANIRPSLEPQNTKDQSSDPLSKSPVDDANSSNEEEETKGASQTVLPEPVVFSVFDKLREAAPTTGFGRWTLEEANEWRARFSFLHGGVSLNVSLGHPRPVENIAENSDGPCVVVRHWTVSSVEARRHGRVPSGDAALAARLLLRRLSPARLHQLCPSTERLSEALAAVSADAERAARFALALHEMGASHAPFAVVQQRVTVGFASLRPTFVFSLSVDFARGLGEAGKSVEVHWDVGTDKVRERIEPSVLELSAKTTQGWDYLPDLVEKVDAFLKDFKRSESQ